MAGLVPAISIQRAQPCHPKRDRRDTRAFTPVFRRAMPGDDEGFAMQTRQLGRNGPSVSALGLGCMGFSGGSGPVVDLESITTVEAALDSRVNYLDTGDI